MTATQKSQTLSEKDFLFVEQALQANLKESSVEKVMYYMEDGSRKDFLRKFYEHGLRVMTNLRPYSEKPLPATYTAWEKSIPELDQDCTLRYLDNNFLVIVRHNSYTKEIDGWIFAHKENDVILAITSQAPTRPYIFTEMRGFKGSGSEHFAYFIVRGYHKLWNQLVRW